MKITSLNQTTEYTIIFDAISEPSNRAAAVHYQTAIESIQHNLYRSGRTSLKILDEPYKMGYYGAPFKKSSPWLKTFNEMLGKMEANGMMEKWRRFQSLSTTKLENIGPQVLTMDHLKFGFLACFIPLTLGVVALFGEFTWSRIVTMSKKSSNDSNFKPIIEAPSKTQVFDSNPEEPGEKTMIKMDNIREIALSRKSLEGSNEPKMETTFQIVEEVDGIAIELCNFDKNATCSQLNSEVKFVDDTKNAIDEYCVDNVGQGERDDIDGLIDQINFKPCVEMSNFCLNQIV